MNADFDLKFFLAVLPLIIVNVSLVIWSLIDWSKRSKFKLMQKNYWIVLILFVQFVGPLMYLLMGRDNGND